MIVFLREMKEHMEAKIKSVREKKRIYYLDILRGLAVLFMVMQHSILMLEYTGGNNTGVIGTILIILGTAPAAPVFMFVMGVFIMKSKAGHWSFVRRGLKLLFAGYVLNFIRFSIPMLLDGNLEESIKMLFYVDIFQLAGVFFITAILFRKLANNLYFTPLFILAVLSISPYLWGLPPEMPITNLLWGTGETVSFPYFPWCVYPLLGMYLSKYVCHSYIEKRHRKIIVLSAIVLGTVGFFILEMFPYLDYERFGLGASMAMIAFVLIYMIIIERTTNLLDLTPKNRIIGLVVSWSTNITNIYWVSWILFTIIALIIGFNGFNDMISGLIGILVMIMTHLIIKYTKINRIIPKI